MEFQERLKNLPLDFYFDNEEHFFYGCKGIIRDSKIINPDAIAPSLTNFCHILFDFTINNLDKIKELKLRYPTEVYSLELRLAKEPQGLLEALKMIEPIMTDYKKMFNMSFDEIKKSDLNKYFEPKRFNKDEKEEEKKRRNKLKDRINSTFSWDGCHIDKERLVNELYNLIDTSGIYRIYNGNKELIYIGKSYTLGSRIPSSLKERKGYMFDYCIIPNKADTDIYEIYYIATLQPICNELSNTGYKPTVTLPPLIFSDIIDVYTDKITTKFSKLQEEIDYE